LLFIVACCHDGAVVSSSGLDGESV
jgi:hypothetical protein